MKRDTNDVIYGLNKSPHSEALLVHEQNRAELIKLNSLS